jgi:hypothetical protein
MVAYRHYRYGQYYNSSTLHLCTSGFKTPTTNVLEGRLEVQSDDEDEPPSLNFSVSNALRISFLYTPANPGTFPCVHLAARRRAWSQVSGPAPAWGTAVGTRAQVGIGTASDGTGTGIGIGTAIGRGTGGFWCQHGANVGQNTALGDVQLLVVADGQLNVARHDVGLLVVANGVAGKLKHFCCQVLRDGSQVAYLPVRRRHPDG